MSNYILEAFKELRLVEDDFNMADFDKDKVDELTSFMSDDLEETPEEEIIDVKAENDDELLDSYIGKVIIECDCCHARLYKDEDEVVIDEEAGLANIEEECPVCNQAIGYRVIGKIEPFDNDGDEVQQPEAKVEDEPEEVADDLDDAVSEDDIEESLSDDACPKCGKNPCMCGKEESLRSKRSANRRRTNESYINEGSSGELAQAVEDACHSMLTEIDHDVLADILQEDPYSEDGLASNDDFWDIADYFGVDVAEVIDLAKKYFSDAGLSESCGKEINEAPEGYDYSRVSTDFSRQQEADHFSDIISECSDRYLDAFSDIAKKFNGRLVKLAEAINTTAERFGVSGADICPELINYLGPDAKEASTALEPNNEFGQYVIGFADNSRSNGVIIEALTEGGYVDELGIVDASSLIDYTPSLGGSADGVGVDEYIEESFKTENEFLKWLGDYRAIFPTNISVAIKNTYDALDKWIYENGGLRESCGKEKADDTKLNEANICCESCAIQFDSVEEMDKYIEAIKSAALEKHIDYTFDEVARESLMIELQCSSSQAEELMAIAMDGDKLTESVEVHATDESDVTFTKEDDGTINIALGAKAEEEFGGDFDLGEDDITLNGDETIAPLSDDEKSAIEDNSNEEIGDELADVGEYEAADELSDIDIDNEQSEGETGEEAEEEPELTEESYSFRNFDDSGFNRMCESFLRKTYDNVNSFIVKRVTESQDSFNVHGTIVFKSGKTGNTTFTFTESKMDKGNSLILEGYNSSFSEKPGSFKLYGKLENGNLTCDKFKYNYNVNTLNESKETISTRVHGIIR